MIKNHNLSKNILKKSNIINKPKILIDNVSQHPTPEGLSLTLMPVGMMPRLSAWIFDFFIRILILVVLLIPLAIFGATGIGLWSILFFLIYWLYPVFFEVRNNGVTPGKKRQGIYVCHDDGTPITLQSSMIRNLLRVADFLPMMFMSAAITMMFNKKSQRLGDIVAGTVVVYNEQDDIASIYRSVYGMVDKQMYKQNITSQSQYDNSSFNSYSNSYDTNSPLFTFPLTLSEQQSLLSLSDRLVFLPQDRQHEITNHLSPLVKNVNQLGMQSNVNQAMVYQAVLDKAASIRGGKS